MKKTAVIFLLMILIFPLLFVSCRTTKEFQIPGEEKLHYADITAEYFSIAKGYEDLKNYSKAAEYYRLAMTNPDLYDTAFYQTGICYVLSKDWTKAEEVFRELLQKDPENITLLSSIAYIKANSGNLQEAETLYRELYEKVPTDITYLKNLITILMTEERYETAEKYYFILRDTFPDEQSLVTLQTKLADCLENTEVTDKDKTENKTEN